MLLAVASAALGYAEGGALAREYGGWRVICWVLIISVPVLLPVVAVRMATAGLSAGLEVWYELWLPDGVQHVAGFLRLVPRARTGRAWPESARSSSCK